MQQPQFMSIEKLPVLLFHHRSILCEQQTPADVAAYNIEKAADHVILKAE